MADEDQEQSEEKKSSGSMLQIINLVLLLLVLAVGGFIAWKMIEMEKTPVAQEEQVNQTEETVIPEAEDESTATSIMIEIDNITVNLADTEVSRFLRAKIKLEVRSEGAQKAVEDNMVKINDLVITLFSGKKFSEIRTPQGKYALKEDLVYRINRLVGGKPVKNLYFTDFVSQ